MTAFFRSQLALFMLLWIMLTLLATSTAAECTNGIPSPTDSSVCASCDATHFGPTCSNPCTCIFWGGVCKNGTAGDGKCSACYRGFYGENCEKRCLCVAGTCDNRPTDDAGKCTSCDNENLSGDLCNVCKEGIWGVRCDKACTCMHGTCYDGFQGDGLCIKGTCEAGWYGKNCDSDVKSVTATPSLIPPTVEATPEPSNLTDPVEPTPEPTPVPTQPITPSPALGAVAAQLVFLSADQDIDVLTATLASTLQIDASTITCYQDPAFPYSVWAFIEEGPGRVGFDRLATMEANSDPKLAQIGLASMSFLTQVQWDAIFTQPPASAAPLSLPPEPSDDDDGIPVWGLALIGIGALVGFVVFLYCCWTCYVSWRRNKYNEKTRKRAVGFHPVGRSALKNGGEHQADGVSGDDEEAFGIHGGDSTAVDLPQPTVKQEDELTAPPTASNRFGGGGKAAKYAAPMPEQDVSLGQPPKKDTAEIDIEMGPLTEMSGSTQPPRVDDLGGTLPPDVVEEENRQEPEFQLSETPKPKFKRKSNVISNPDKPNLGAALPQPRSVSPGGHSPPEASTDTTPPRVLPPPHAVADESPGVNTSGFTVHDSGQPAAADDNDALYTPPEDPLDVDLDIDDDGVAPAVDDNWGLNGDVSVGGGGGGGMSRLVVDTSPGVDSDEDSDIA